LWGKDEGTSGITKLLIAKVIYSIEEGIIGNRKPPRQFERKDGR
jgi:hypothetical protein